MWRLVREHALDEIVHRFALPRLIFPLLSKFSVGQEPIRKSGVLGKLA
jgi:hypothetical protein